MTVITAPGALPSDWFEWPPPPWRVQHAPRHCCPEHAADGRDLHGRQWAMFTDRSYEVSVEEFDRVRRELHDAASQLDRLKLSAQRASGQEM
jgi:hypothetical protein